MIRFSLLLNVCVACCVVFVQGKVGAFEEPTDPKSIRRVTGFEVELVRSAQKGEDSWISMCFDDKGRVILGLDKKGVARLDLKEGQKATFERINNEFKHCRGVLFAFGYVYVDSTDGRKLVRLEDRDNDGRFESQTNLINFDYRSRYGHGSNQMRLGPDGKIYVVIGNDVSFPEGILDSSPYRDPRNDWLLPESRDQGHDNRVGYILQMDKDGQQKKIIAGGFRNQVDMDFDPHGEMFTFDADMEWDIGAPWYRPIRVNQIVSGGEYGWRWGTGKWPAYYPDSLPSNLDVGMGSPTGVVFGTKSHFPKEYRNALFIADWQNGRILAAHKKSKGASYAFEYESFLDGAPLNVCDMEFGPDGSLYFITGGRGSQSALYRVAWAGPKESGDVKKPEELNALQKRRRELERFHQKEDPTAINNVWKDLASSDPWIRHAARIAVERQPVSQWERRALIEEDFDRALTGLLALARMKLTDDKNRSTFQISVVKRLLELVDEMESKKDSKLSSQEWIKVFRICGVLFARHGPSVKQVQLILQERLSDQFPLSDERVNCEWLELLVYLGDRSSLPKGLKLLRQNSVSRESQIHLARSLAHFEQPWEPEQNREYLKWLSRAQAFRGGNLLPKVIVQMQVDFVAKLSDSQKTVLKSELDALEKPTQSQHVFHDREHLKAWKIEDLDQIDIANGDAAKGKQIFIEAGCSSCHRKNQIGGQTGPDLSNVGKRFDTKALLESIIEPSKQIDPKYALSTYALVDGRTLTGRAHGVNARTLTLETDPILQTTVTIQREDIENSKTADLSPMPKALLDCFSKSEIVDLIQYLKTDSK